MFVIFVFILTIMDTRTAYNNWAQQYDTNRNRTRDMEAQTLRSILADVPFSQCLEIGCGTGKNTVWLAEKAERIKAVDLSEEMLAKAKEKITSDKVDFEQADITQTWNFGNGYDLVTFCLVLEHIDNLDHIFAQAARAIRQGGHIYVGELHPFKQYTGTKARFDTEEGRHEVECFNHHVTDFLSAAHKNGFALVALDEHFDDNDRNQIPRILTLLLRKI